MRFRNFALIVVCVLLFSACSTAQSSTPVSNEPKTPLAVQPTPVSTALFQVVRADGTSMGFTWDDLKKLPLANLTIEGKVEEGPKLADVLKAA